MRFYYLLNRIISQSRHSVCSLVDAWSPSTSPWAMVSLTVVFCCSLSGCPLAALGKVAGQQCKKSPPPGQSTALSLSLSLSLLLAYCLHVMSCHVMSVLSLTFKYTTAASTAASLMNNSSLNHLAVKKHTKIRKQVCIRY